MSQCTKPEALKIQVGGDHYSKLKIGPTEFAMANGWDPCATNILKYVTRHESKNGRPDLDKALHYADLRAELCSYRWHHLSHSVSIEAYCEANKLGAYESAVLQALDRAVWENSVRAYLELKVALDHLIYERYGKPPNHDEVL